jgi:phage FluMu gp28-like protein
VKSEDRNPKPEGNPKAEIRRTAAETYFMPYQAAWIRDEAHLKICEKGRQIGLSYADSYDSVRKAAQKNGRDVWVMSRDEIQAKQYVLYCKRWANVLKYAAEDHGEQVFTTENGKSVKVQVLSFASGANVYALSSNPDAIVGKTGHVKLDEFALHKDQRMLYAVARPVIQWGGTLSIISTHRGVGTVFNQLIQDIKERGNKMGWSLHTVPIQRAVEDGIVEKIDMATGGEITARWKSEDRNPKSEGSQSLREYWVAKQQAECIDEEQWLQEYCCVPADESSAFISYEMITAAETDGCHRDYEYLKVCPNPLFIGWDVARKGDLSVIDVEELAGDVMWERMRVEMRGKTYAEQEGELYRLLALPAVRRCCIDATGLGNQLAERAVQRWGYRAEAVTFTAAVKQDLAGPLRMAHEDRKIRYPREEALRADLRGVKKEVTSAGNIRFVGEAADSHCDRFWAKALAVHAAGKREAEYTGVLV